MTKQQDPPYPLRLPPKLKQRVLDYKEDGELKMSEAIIQLIKAGLDAIEKV